MKLNRLTAVTLTVKDQERAKSFYVDLLGFETIADKEMGPIRWLQVAPKGGLTSLVLASPQQGISATNTTFLMETPDLDSDCAELEANGIAIDGPNQLPWARQATFTDPDGNQLVLQSTGD